MILLKFKNSIYHQKDLQQVIPIKTLLITRNIPIVVTVNVDDDDEEDIKPIAKPIMPIFDPTAVRLKRTSSAPPKPNVEDQTSVTNSNNSKPTIVATSNSPAKKVSVFSPKKTDSVDTQPSTVVSPLRKTSAPVKPETDNKPEAVNPIPFALKKKGNLII